VHSFKRVDAEPLELRARCRGRFTICQPRA
jgi:hypothetical protein